MKLWQLILAGVGGFLALDYLIKPWRCGEKVGLSLPEFLYYHSRWGPKPMYEARGEIEGEDGQRNYVIGWVYDHKPK